MNVWVVLKRNNSGVALVIGVFAKKELAVDSVIRTDPMGDWHNDGDMIWQNQKPNVYFIAEQPVVTEIMTHEESPLVPPEVTNAVVAQKDKIINFINEGKLQQAITILDFVAPLWNYLNYGYKVKELAVAIRDKVNKNLSETETFRDQHRKNSSHWLFHDKQVGELSAMLNHDLLK